jgi:hypothetical protein
VARHRGPVLVDTNVMLECWRVGAWRALASGYGVETVEDYVIETQMGYQRRRPERRINVQQLRASLAAVHKVGDAELAAAIVRDHASRCRGAVSLGACSHPRRCLGALRTRQGKLADGREIGVSHASCVIGGAPRSRQISAERTCQVCLYEQVAGEDARRACAL